MAIRHRLLIWVDSAGHPDGACIETYRDGECTAKKVWPFGPFDTTHEVLEAMRVSVDSQLSLF